MEQKEVDLELVPVELEQEQVDSALVVEERVDLALVEQEQELVHSQSSDPNSAQWEDVVRSYESLCRSAQVVRSMS